jgi:hypothetical protein
MVLALGFLVGVLDDRRRRRMREARVAEDIGTFVRALDRRAEWFDPRVVRAVWDALRAERGTSEPPIPLRPMDRLSADLGIEADDLDFDVLPEIAARTGRTLERAEVNPYYGRVETVMDLIRFVAAQPPSPAA